MGFLNTDSMPRLVEKLADGDNIRISGNSKGNRVGTVVKKIVEKADDVTKAIEQEVVNDGYSFKVGTGDVDVSTDVEDGFGEVGVKGVTYQNLLSCKKEVIVEGTGAWENGQVHSYLVKPNTKYTLFFEIESIEKGDYNFNPVIQTFSNNALILSQNTKPFSFQTNSDTEFITFRLLINGENASITNCKSIFKNLVLLEGNHTNNLNIPTYFEGIVGVGDKSKNLFDSGLKLGNISWETGVENNLQQHVMSAEYIKVRPNTKYIIHSNTSHKLNLYFYDNSKVISAPSLEGVAISFTTNSTTEYIKVLSVNNTDLSNSRFQLEEGDVATSYEPYHDGYKIEILSNGDNIYDYTKITDNTYINTSGDIVNYTGWFSTDYIRVNKNKKYYFYNQKHRVPFAGLYCYYYDTNKNKIEYLNLGDTEFVGLTEFVSKHDGYIRLSGLSHSIQVGRMYASYDKTQILLDEPLMRLPNGVCDEITRDGKLIRRVGKKFIDANISGLSHNGTSSNHNQFVIHKGVVTPNSINHANLLCDKKPCKVDNSGSNSVWVYNKATLVFQMDSTINSVEKMRQWLSQNPTTVYYELETPVITELPAPCLRIFKNGHLTFNTLVAPESTHVVQLNKSAQIQNAIKESQSLDNRINVLENNYDNLMLSTISRLNDLELNYTLK